MDIVDVEDPDGVVVTLGGQTPLKLARALQEAGVPIMGTSPEAIDLAEDRDRFSQVLDELKIIYPAAGEASTLEEAHRVAEHISFPLLVRPSYVLGGRGMAIVYDNDQLDKYMAEAAKISPDHPVYLDRFLEAAIEVDVDALCDGKDVFVGGILEHIEMAGIHSATPPAAHRRSRSRSAFRNSCATSHAALRCAWASFACSTFSSPLKTRSST